MLREEEKKAGTILTVIRKEDGKIAVESTGLGVDEVPNLLYAIADIMYRTGSEACGFNHDEIMTSITNVIVKVAEDNARKQAEK